MSFNAIARFLIARVITGYIAWNVIGATLNMLGKQKKRIIDRFQGHIFDIKHNNNTTMARHFGSHNDHLDSNMTIHTLEYIRLPKDILRSNSLRDSRELVWILRLNTLIPNGLNILD